MSEAAFSDGVRVEGQTCSRCGGTERHFHADHQRVYDVDGSFHYEDMVIGLPDNGGPVLD